MTSLGHDQIAKSPIRQVCGNPDILRQIAPRAYHLAYDTLRILNLLDQTAATNDIARKKLRYAALSMETA